MSFELPQLPYAKDALAPHMSAETFDYHYGKHHAAYVNKLNAAIEGKPEEKKTLEELVQTTEGGLFNNAAQHWNHSFFWKCLKPNGGGKATGDLAQAIDRDFGSFEAFVKQFSDTAAAQFGSGWGWLVSDQGKLKIESTSNADVPLRHGRTPLLTIDVWEHAYYVDYRNKRPDFIKAVMESLVNWDFVGENLKQAK